VPWVYRAKRSVLSTLGGRERFLTKFCDCWKVKIGNSYFT
jgi:hypothetical protein